MTYLNDIHIFQCYHNANEIDYRLLTRIGSRKNIYWVFNNIFRQMLITFIILLSNIRASYISTSKKEVGSCCIVLQSWCVRPSGFDLLKRLPFVNTQTLIQLLYRNYRYILSHSVFRFSKWTYASIHVVPPFKMVSWGKTTN